MTEVECRIKNGVSRWFVVGTDIIHGEDGPAIIWPNGAQTWMKYGVFHREDGPAIICGISQKWFNNGLLHRIDGPAIIEGDHVEYWLNGEKFSAEAYQCATFILYKKRVNYDKTTNELFALRHGESTI